MADSSNELTVPKPDAGMAFRMEMWATNALLGYWWVLVGIIVALCPVVTGRGPNSAGYFMMLGLLLFPVSMMCRSLVLMLVGIVLILFGLPMFF